MSPLREGEETALSLIKSGPRRPLMHAWNESSSGGTAYGCARINDGACGTMYRRVSSRSRCRSFYSVTVVQWYRYRSTCLSEAGIMPLFLSRPSEKRPCARMLERPVPRHRRVSHDIHVRRSHQGEPEERAKFITISLLSPKRSRFAGFATRSAIPRMFLLEIGLFGISSLSLSLSLSSLASYLLDTSRASDSRDLRRCDCEARTSSRSLLRDVTFSWEKRKQDVASESTFPSRRSNSLCCAVVVN